VGQFEGPSGAEACEGDRVTWPSGAEACEGVRVTWPSGAEACEGVRVAWEASELKPCCGRVGGRTATAVSNHEPRVLTC
jgi:hypothetical protein